MNTSTSKGKWAPPTTAENNKRVIDGKPMWYNKSKKRWYPDKYPLAEQAQVSQPPASTLTADPNAATAVTPSSNVARDEQVAQLKASLSNMEKMYMASFSKLHDQFADL